MDRDARIQTVRAMCREHGCSDKIQKIHFDQYVDRNWHPHPSAGFVDWWANHLDHKLAGLAVKPAWNTQRYRDEFNEIRSFGGA